MNAMAQGENVLGDFSGTATLHYLGGKATFFEADGGFRVRLRFYMTAEQRQPVIRRLKLMIVPPP